MCCCLNGIKSGCFQNCMRYSLVPYQHVSCFQMCILTERCAYNEARFGRVITAQMHYMHSKKVSIRIILFKTLYTWEVIAEGDLGASRYDRRSFRIYRRLMFSIRSGYKQLLGDSRGGTWNLNDYGNRNLEHC